MLTRVRPFATVYLDGALLGETPLPVQEVAAGKHTLRLVNEKEGKDVSHAVDLAPGDNLLKYNLKE